ncbi:MAG: hypothetical protein NVS9B1_11660 [Candidatus Dormibacteraceae bacterium]
MRIDRSPADVFDWVADHRNVPRVMEGVTRWDPLGKQTEGIGARFRVELGALGVGIPATLRISRWERPHEIGWETEKSPVDNHGHWTFTPRDGGTEVQLNLRYVPPAGGIGNFLAARVEGVVRSRIKRALQRMKTTLEAE